MIVKAVEVTLRLHRAFSLKDKRQVLKSLTDQVSRRFNVAIAEVDAQDKHGSIVLGIACVSNSGRHADLVLDRVLRWIEAQIEADIVSVENW